MCHAFTLKSGKFLPFRAKQCFVDQIPLSISTPATRTVSEKDNARRIRINNAHSREQVVRLMEKTRSDTSHIKERCKYLVGQIILLNCEHVSQG